MADGEAILTVMGITLAVGVFSGLMIGEYFDQAKKECESTLPRDVECIWSPPLEYDIEETPQDG